MESIASRALPHTPKRWHTWDAFADPPKDLRCGDGVRRYGHVFVWTKDHMTAAELAFERRQDDARASIGGLFYSKGVEELSKELVEKHLGCSASTKLSSGQLEALLASMEEDNHVMYRQGVVYLI